MTTGDGAAIGDPFDGIELVVFDKDGTLIDFDTMWSDWSVGLVRDVTAATDPDLAGPLADALGLDPHDRPGSSRAARCRRRRWVTCAT